MARAFGALAVALSIFPAVTGAAQSHGINPADFGLPALLGDSIEIVVDAEFAKAP